MTRRAALVLLASSLSPLTGCGDTAAPVVGGHEVLFFGNSLTFANDLPGTVAAIAAADGYTLHAAQGLTSGGALIDAVNEGGAAASIARQAHWDYVVLQQGPTTLQVCHDTMMLAMKLLDTMIRRSGARPALLMTWPAAQDSANGTFDVVRESFQSAAKSVDAMFLPAGEAWRLAWHSDPSLQLYGQDGFHPAPLGTYLMALVVYERVSGHDVRTLSTEPVTIDGERVTVPPETLRLLQRAAHNANVMFGAGTVEGLPPRPSPNPLVC
jgi:hypothetical protein